MKNYHVNNCGNWGYAIILEYDVIFYIILYLDRTPDKTNCIKIGKT
jgi:hypothetical protein